MAKLQASILGNCWEWCSSKTFLKNLFLLSAIHIFLFLSTYYFIITIYIVLTVIITIAIITLIVFSYLFIWMKNVLRNFSTGSLCCLAAFPNWYLHELQCNYTKCLTVFFPKISNSVFPQNFRTRKLGEVSVFYTVMGQADSKPTHSEKKTPVWSCYRG